MHATLAAVVVRELVRLQAVCHSHCTTIFPITEMSARKCLPECLCLWILCHSCFCQPIPFSPSHHSIERRFDYEPDYIASSPIFPNFFDSDSMEETSSSGDEISDSSVSDDKEDEGQEDDEIADASSHPIVRLRPSTLPDQHSMNQDQAIDQSINSDSFPPSRAMIDELLGRSSTEVKQLQGKADSGEDLFAAAGRHYRQPDTGHQGFFQ